MLLPAAVECDLTPNHACVRKLPIQVASVPAGGVGRLGVWHFIDQEQRTHDQQNDQHGIRL